VVGPHPLARGWYKINLDPNEITPHNDWSAPRDRLTRIDEKEDVGDVPALTQLRHFP